MKIFHGAKQQARDIQNEVDSFLRIFTDEIIEYITECPNLHISNVTWVLIYGRSYQKQKFLELWTSDGTVSEIFRAFMSKNRFLFLLAVIRFDDKSSKKERKR